MEKRKLPLLKEGSDGRFPRVDLKAIYADPVLKRELMIRVVIATQAREGIDTTWEQAARAYDTVMAEKERARQASPLPVEPSTASGDAAPGPARRRRRRD